jgi:hypothetical protein
MIGRQYHRVYGYPWRWAILAELAWRVEHMMHDRLSRDDAGMRLPRWIGRQGYAYRKRFERRGAA